MKILVINGPNLNFLGIREKNIYGNENYEYLVNMINEYCKSKNIEVECYQSNHEGAIINPGPKLDNSVIKSRQVNAKNTSIRAKPFRNRKHAIEPKNIAIIHLIIRKIK